MKKLLSIAALALIPAVQAPPLQAQASARQVAGQTRPSPLAPGEIVAAAPQSDWQAITPSNLLVMDLAPDARGAARRVVIQLMPAPFSQSWIGNIRKLAAAHWWDGLSINRVQDNYVVQWGDGGAEDAAKAKPLPAGLLATREQDYVTSARECRPWRGRNPAWPLIPMRGRPDSFAAGRLPETTATIGRSIAMAWSASGVTFPPTPVRAPSYTW